MDFTLQAFISGTHNLLNPEVIPKDAAQDSSNFVTQDGKIVLVPGRELLGAAGVVGGTTGLHKAFKTTGASLFFAKRGTAIMFYNGAAWQNCVTGLSATDEYTFANYSSLAGAFTYINGAGGFFKVITSHPASPINIAHTTNFLGRILIDRGRMLLWNRASDKTGLYGSWIDRQNSTVYSTVAGESLGALGGTVYAGTLAFKASGVRRSCFGVSVTALTGAGQETFADNFNGILTSNFGGTGTINYATGAYSVTFANITTGNVTGNYQYEDSAVQGVADFSHAVPRVAGQGFQFPQDEGGDEIMNVLVGQDGAYYSLKKNSAYFLSIDADDAGAKNEVFRKDMGLPFFRAGASTNKGIFFINTSNPTKPEMTILQKSTVSLSVEPRVLFKHFKFSDFVFDATSITTYDRWMVVFCRTAASTTNDRILMCNIETNTVDVVAYSGKMGIQDGQSFYVADSITQSVYSTFNGFDDLGSAISAHWTGRDELMDTTNLKKTRRLWFKGFIGVDQSVGIHINLDSQGFQKVGTIVGSESYVSAISSQSIGGNFIGEAQLGGSDVSSASSYFIESKIKTGKFRKISIKLVPEGIGYFDFNMIVFWDNLLFEARLPKAFRQKQNVSLSGVLTDV